MRSRRLVLLAFGLALAIGLPSLALAGDEHRYRLHVSGMT